MKRPRNASVFEEPNTGYLYRREQCAVRQRRITQENQTPLGRFEQHPTRHRRRDDCSGEPATNRCTCNERFSRAVDEGTSNFHA